LFFNEKNPVFQGFSDLFSYVTVKEPYHGSGEKYFQAYSDEFTYRLNRRDFHCGFFKNFLSAVSHASPLPLAVIKEQA